MDSENRPFDVLVELYRRQGRIALQRDGLKVSGPENALTSSFLTELSGHKATLLTWLGGHADAEGMAIGTPLSMAQQEIWAVEQANSWTTRFNLTSGVLLKGTLDSALVADVLSALIERHVSLRTRIVEGPDGVPCQFIRPVSRITPGIEQGPARLPADADSLLQRIVLEQNKRPFDLGADPLLDLYIASVGDGHAVLALRRHHIASDGISFAIIIDEFCRLYRALAKGQTAEIGGATLGYPAFIAYEAAARADQEGQALRSWWSDTLRQSLSREPAVPPSASFNARYSNASTSSFRFVVDAPTVAALRGLSRRCGESLYATMFSLFRLLLAACDAPNAECIGVDVSMRDATEFERTVGLFINRLPIFCEIDPQVSFASMVSAAGRAIRATLAHKWLAHHEIAAIAQRADGQIFDYLFGFHNNQHADFVLPGCHVIANFAHRAHEHDVPFVCYMTDVGANIAVTISYRGMPHAQALADGFVESYLQLGRLAAITPEAPCGVLATSISARRRRAEMNRRHAFARLKQKRTVQMPPGERDA